MKFGLAEKTGRGAVIQPAVLAVLIYAGLVGVWGLWFGVNFQFAVIGQSNEMAWLVERPLALGLSAYGWGTAVSVLAVALLLLELVRVRRSPRELRGGHAAGALMGLVVVVCLQLLCEAVRTLVTPG